MVKRFDDVLAVGAGFKKSAGEVSTSVCLGLLVSRKKSRLGKVSAPIPKRLTVSVQRDGKRVQLSIPTDVEELGKGKPQQAINAAAGIRAFNRSNSTQGVPGAACCVVVDQSDAANRFVLGCHHVLALSLLTTGCEFFKDTDVSGRGAVQKFGGLFHPLPMAADGLACLDAALALVDAGTEVTWVSGEGIKPVRVEPGTKQPVNCFVFTPDGPLPAVFVKEWANVPLQYPRCGTVTIAAAYQFQVPTVGGHSGSPVMTPDGTLHGMHFWGDEQQQLAMAIPAFMLFRPGLFPVNFRLA
ncbi:MAG: hypothetical protein Q7U73_12795 [Rubrivivax sp.]|nr:hypothetical protein [Rubrivivax sp.]